MHTMKDRPKALEARVAQEGGVLTESQRATPEKARADKQAHGGLDSEHPAHCVDQDLILPRERGRGQGRHAFHGGR